MKTAEQINRKLWTLLGIKVITGAALARDGITWLPRYVRADDGFFDPPANFWNDMRETLKRLPRDVQFHLKWSTHTEQWCRLLFRGTEIYEAFGATEDEAAARAFEQFLIAQAVTA